MVFRSWSWAPWRFLHTPRIRYPPRPNATASQQQSRAQQLYGDIWERRRAFQAGSEPGDRQRARRHESPDQLRSHLAIAKRNGVTEAELIETITHLAFYSGWPNAVSATAVAKDVFKK